MAKLAPHFGAGLFSLEKPAILRSVSHYRTSTRGKRWASAEVYFTEARVVGDVLREGAGAPGHTSL